MRNLLVARYCSGWRSGLFGVAALMMLAAISGCSAPVDNTTSHIPEGPEGLAFYDPPSPLPEGEHGDLIWARPLTNDAVLPAASENWLVLYRSTSITGEPIAVSGTVAIPEGTPPEGGWPVISWAHGTVGIADKCAPSRNDADYPAAGYIDLMDATLNKWVKKGYAVVATDYQGLGTPGVHLYLVGQAEARSATDIVYAARQLNAKISRNWLAMGHSQGGGAAVYTAFLGPVYGQGLNLQGAIAISPNARVSVQMKYVAAHIKSKSLPAAPTLPVLFEGMAAAAPGVDLSSLYTQAGAKAARLVNKRCVAGIWKYFHQHGLTQMSDILRADADYSKLNKAFASLVDNKGIRPSVPLLVIQADNDEVAIKRFTDMMVNRYKILGVPLTYHVVHIEDKSDIPSYHQATVPLTREYAMDWAAKRFTSAYGGQH